MRDTEQSYRGWTLDVNLLACCRLWRVDFWYAGQVPDNENYTERTTRKEAIAIAKSRIDAIELQRSERTSKST